MPSAARDPLAGRIPITLIGEIFMVVFGVVGLVMNTYFVEASEIPWVSLLWTLPGATILAYGAQSATARVLAPLVDDRPAAATKRNELIGSIRRGLVARPSENPASHRQQRGFGRRQGRQQGRLRRVEAPRRICQELRPQYPGARPERL